MKKLLCTLAVTGALMAPGAVQAQVNVVGALAAYHDDAEALGIGAYAGLSLASVREGLSLVPSFIFYFPDGSDLWELNGDIVYAFPVSAESPVLPFANGGINLQHVSSGAFSDTDVGINLGGGVIFPLESVRPVVGAKFEIQDNTSFVLFGGVGFPIG